MLGLLKQLNHLGQRQWRHRCKFKAEVTQPDEKEYMGMLDNELETEYMKGTTTLFDGDKSLVEYTSYASL
jgi:hypothetical protein